MSEHFDSAKIILDDIDPGRGHFAAGADKPHTAIMSHDRASNVAVLFFATLGIAGTLATLFTICYRWSGAIDHMTPGRDMLHPTESNALIMVALMGVLGGFIHFSSSLAQYVGNRQLTKSWLLYYLLMPIESAALAPLVFLILRVGVLSPGTGSVVGSCGLNYIGLYAFAGLTGMFSKQAIEKLADVFSTLFKRVPGEDPLRPDGRAK